MNALLYLISKNHLVDDIINFTSINSAKIHKLDLNNLITDMPGDTICSKCRKTNLSTRSY